MNGLTLTCQVVWPKMSKGRDTKMCWYQQIGKQLQVAYPIWDTSLLTELDMVTMEQLFTDANLLDVWEARRPGFQVSRNCLSETTFSIPEFGWWFAASGMSWTLLAFSGMMSYPWENNNVCNFAGRGCRCPMDGESRKHYLIGIKDQKNQIGTRNIKWVCPACIGIQFMCGIYADSFVTHRLPHKKSSWMNDSPAASCRIASNSD